MRVRSQGPDSRAGAVDLNNAPPQRQLSWSRYQFPRGTCANVQTCLSRDPHAILECADPGAKLDRFQHGTSLQVAAPGQSVHMLSWLSSNNDHTRSQLRSLSMLCWTCLDTSMTRRYRDFCDFQNCGYRHLEFSKIQNFNGRSAVGANVRHLAKFRQNRSNGCRDMAIKLFSK